MIRMNPIPMPMLARIDAIATEPTNGSAAETVARRSRSTRPVPDVLHGLHQRRLQQEHAEHG